MILWAIFCDLSGFLFFCRRLFQLLGQLVIPFIIGFPIPDNPLLVQSVSHIYGIGLSESRMLCQRPGFGHDSRGIRVTPQKSKLFEILVDNNDL